MFRDLKNIIAQGPINAYRFDGDDDLAKLSLRGFPLACLRDHTVAMFPEIHGARDFVQGSIEILAEILSIRESEKGKIIDPVFVPWSSENYLLEEGIINSLQFVRDELLRRSNNFRYWPYQNTRETRSCLNELNKNGDIFVESALPLIDEISAKSLLSNRSGWGRDATMIEEPSIVEIFGIPYPISCSGRGIEQLLIAYDYVSKASGRCDVFFKIDSSAGGFGIAKVNSREDLTSVFENFFNAGMLENGNKLVQIQQAMEVLGDYSIQYQDSRIITPGNISSQIIRENEWVGNVFHTTNTNKFKVEANRIMKLINHALADSGESLEGWGGLDLLHVENSGNEQLVVLEHNSRRLTGAIPATTISRFLGLDNKPFVFTKIFGNPKGSVKEVWEFLKQKKLSYEYEDKKGVYPVLWLEQGGYMIISGFENENYLQYSDMVHNTLRKGGYLE